MSLDTLPSGLGNPVWRAWQEVTSATACSKQQQQQCQTMCLGAFSSPVLKSSKIADPTASHGNLLQAEVYPWAKRCPFVYNVGFYCFNLHPQSLTLLPCTSAESLGPTSQWPAHRQNKAGLRSPQSLLFSRQNHRIVWVGKDLKDHLVPVFLPWAGTPSTRPGCSKTHPTCQGWGSHSFSGQPVPMPHHPHSKEFLPNI